jgi:putative membrane protein
MKALLVAAGAAVLLAGCASREAEPEPVAMVDPSSPLSAPGYMRMAASSDMFEIESSRLALQRSQNPAVRSFAQMMIDHHTRTTQDMMATAQAAGMTPPPPMMAPHHMEMLDRLRGAPASDFDAAYKREQIAAHQEALMLHRNYAASGDMAPFRDLAGRTVPIIEGHLSQAQGLPEYMSPPPAAAPVRAGERG